MKKMNNKVENIVQLIKKSGVKNVEVMKSFHKVLAEVSGKVKSIEVEDEGMVRAGDILMKVEPEAV